MGGTREHGVPLGRALPLETLDRQRLKLLLLE